MASRLGDRRQQRPEAPYDRSIPFLAVAADADSRDHEPARLTAAASQNTMTFLSRLLRVVPKSERGGIRLDEPDPWVVAPTQDVELFLRALPRLAPDGAMVYFEDTGERHVRDYLRRVAVEPRVQVAIGTVWPRPDRYHVPLTSVSMQELADFLAANPAGFFCAHCHVYRGTSVLLEWDDAFSDVPMYVSSAVPIETVDAFAAALGSSRTRMPGR